MTWLATLKQQALEAESAVDAVVDITPVIGPNSPKALSPNAFSDTKVTALSVDAEEPKP